MTKQREKKQLKIVRNAFLHYYFFYDDNKILRLPTSGTTHLVHQWTHHQQRAWRLSLG